MQSGSPLIPKKAEILAPAGSIEAAVAAVRCGADAIYLGAQQFSARANAQNFDYGELAETVSYCHERGAKVHLTLNTSLFDSELGDAAGLIEYAARIGVDALIVSDLGVLSLAKNICPSLSLHASTQMGIASLNGALAAHRLGFSRVVLARELSADEIRAITAQEIIETEVFVHGALCMCVSGQCYLSAMLGGRSGNRGRCAQPCRLEFNTHGERGSHALSLKDLSLCDRIGELCDIGVTSLKIEGRMKRPEYVAAAVLLVKASMDGNDTSSLAELSENIFSRSGFTDGYYTKKINKNMFGQRIREDAEKSKAAAPSLHELYRREMPRVPVTAMLSQNGSAVSLAFSDDGGKRAVSRIEISDLNADKIDLNAAKKQLSRLGSTPYYLTDLTAQGDVCALPPSALNQLRRDAAEELSRMRRECIPREIFAHNECQYEKAQIHDSQKIVARFENIGMAAECASLCDSAMLPVRLIVKEYEKISQNIKAKLVAELDRYAFSNDSFTKDALNFLKQNGINRVCVQNISQLFSAADGGFEIIWGPFMNLYNTPSAELLYSLGVSSAVLSFELAAKKADLMSLPLKKGITVYGYLPLMMTRACPLKCDSGCAKCQKDGGALSDRTEAHFRVMCRGTVSEILNSVPLAAELENGNFDRADFLFAYFTVEDASSCKAILRRIKDKKTAVSNDFTRGLYRSGVI